MVLFPRPLPSDEIRGEDHIGELDERALLRWSTNNEAVEVQHLIRNVRRTMLDEERLLTLHRRAADHWGAHLATLPTPCFTSIIDLPLKRRALRKFWRPSLIG